MKKNYSQQQAIYECEVTHNIPGVEVGTPAILYLYNNYFEVRGKNENSNKTAIYLKNRICFIDGREISSTDHKIVFRLLDFNNGERPIEVAIANENHYKEAVNHIRMWLDL